MSERPYCGPDGSKIVDQVAEEVIADPQLRQRWTEFDGRFLKQCIKEGEHGLVFNREGFADFSDHDEELLCLGIKVYNAANREAVDRRSTRYRVLNLLALIYHSALRACRQ